MRRTALASGIALSLLLAACDRTPSEPIAAPAPVATNAAANADASPAVAPAAAPTVVAWGPQTTEQGVAVNVQAGGSSGLWIKMSAPAFGYDTVVTFDGKPVDQIFVTKTGDVLTMMIPSEYISTPGMKPLAVKPDKTSPEIAVGNFEVTPAK